ncbi:MAG: hypothetical protein NC200_02525 [Candidatus Gastranaerophilales bacterium]|nr:hypothetical protein [Candidatus Gastranaerophilales bacterium]
MSTKKYLKKILCIFFAVLFFSIQSLPVLAGDVFYDFSDEAQERFNRQEQSVPVEMDTRKPIKDGYKVKSVKKNEMRKQEQFYSPNVSTPQSVTLQGSVITVPKNTAILAVLESSISTRSLAQNDTISATLSQDWIYRGILIAPRGSIVYGRATDVKRAGYAYSNGKLSMLFYQIITPNGERITLSSNEVYVEAKGSNRAVKMAGNVVVGALSGLVTGVLYSLISGGDVARGVAIGSAVGASGGLVSAVAHKGEDAEVPAGTVINIVLTKSMEAVPYQ